VKPYADYNWIIPNRIAQGGFPGSHPGLFSAFDVIVYMAMEEQPKIRPMPPGKLALYAPIDDDIYRPLPPAVGEQLHILAAECARQASYNKRILITCMQGRNRSGLVTALTLLKLFPGWTSEQAVKIIKRNRPDALTNTMFEQYIHAYGRQ
jgi:protein-tyrosine phosphatase